jgi:pimeloyl-ACP methyl ester carboxylesterase
VAPPAWPRPVLPLPPSVASRYALPDAPVRDEVAATGAEGAVGPARRGTLHCGKERIGYEFWSSPAPRPLVLLVPILAGGADLMQILAQRFWDRGFAVAWAARTGTALQPPQRGPELEELFRRTVVHQRILLHWCRGEPGVRADATFVLGISMGGMVATVVSALEPDLCGSAICLAGGDLPELLLHSGETRVLAWLAWREQTDGLGRSGLRDELARCLVTDPALLAPYVPTAELLFVSAEFDGVVPQRFQSVLWEALGRPARLQVPLGHYSTALALGPIVTAIAAAFHDRLPDPQTAQSCRQGIEQGGMPALARPGGPAL